MSPGAKDEQPMSSTKCVQSRDQGYMIGRLRTITSNKKAQHVAYFFSDLGQFWNLKPSERPVLHKEEPCHVSRPVNDSSRLSPKGYIAIYLNNCTLGKG